jgi:hypothetical protein
MMIRRRLLGVLVLCCHASMSHGFALTRYTQTATSTTTRRQQQEQRREYDTFRHDRAARHWSRSSHAIRSSSSSASNNRQDADDYSALFPRASTYVPSGLTEDEYRRIKTDEASKFAGLNLGAWGPKLLRSRSGGGGPPAGDWMVMPSLWTRGYDATVVGEGASSADPTGTGRRRRLRRQILRACRANLPAFVLGLVVMETIQSLVRLAVVRIFVAASSSWSSSSSALPGRVAATAVVAAMAAPRIRTKYLENESRRLLWSQRRLWCASIAACTVVWMLAARFV